MILWLNKQKLFRSINLMDEDVAFEIRQKRKSA